MAARKTLIRSQSEYVTFGDGFPGFGETDERKASRWKADLFEDAPVSEPENEPVAYTGDEDFPTRGRYSGVGIIVDETGEFDPEPASNPEPAQSAEAKLDLSLFRELYRSRDGRLVFFEHRATGHLAAVDASKLV